MSRSSQVVSLRPDAKKPEPEPWPARMPIKPAPPPALPEHVWPEAFERHAADVAQRVGAPVEFAIATGWGALSALVARTVRAARPGYSTPIQAYLAVVADPSASKSGCFKPMVAPLQAIERERMDRDGPAVLETIDHRELLESRINGLKAAAAKGVTDEQKDEIKRLRVQLAELGPVVVPQLLADDTTPEALASLMCEAGERMAILADEGSILAHVQGAYSKVPNITLLLKSYDGASHKVNRRGRVEHLKDPALTICVMVQPGVIEALVDTEAGKRGLLARFRYFMPDCRIGYRDRSPRPPPDHRIAEAYGRWFRKIAERWLDAESTTICLSAEAETRYARWWAEMETERREGGRLYGTPRFMEWGGKDGECLRLAVLLHVAHGHDDRTEVSVEQVDRAIAYMAVLTEHARHVLDGAPGLSEVQKLATSIARWLRSPTRANPEIISARDAQRQTSRPREEVDAALDLLETLGYVRAIDGPRRDSARFEVNPELLEGEQ